MSGWGGAPVAKHGMSEDEVRAALQETQAQLLNDWRREERAAGTPLRIIERLAQAAERESALRIERDLPKIMRDMAVSAGAAAVH